MKNSVQFKLKQLRAGVDAGRQMSLYLRGEIEPFSVASIETVFEAGIVFRNRSGARVTVDPSDISAVIEA